ncbi:MAG: rhodanese-like domain-containing protein [Oligoflexia bacterium]|nr:rhodanese-like domain-containing protein [Oligoflexia bacterium]
MKRSLIVAFAFLLVACFFIGAASADDRISASQAWSKIKAGALLVDVRSADEFNSGHIEGALNIPHTEISASLKQIGENKGREIVLYCHSGRRAGLARDELIKLGYSNVFNAGAYEGLNSAR